jgi:acetyl-CoA C-acetyltransferase
MSEQAFIYSAARTPIGAFGGSLATVPATQLGAIAIKAALERARAAPQEPDEVIMGNVLSAGLGQNPARQAAIGAGIPTSVGATTVNKVCGSGLKAVMLAAQAIRLGDARIIVAGGMESMSLAPYLLPKARTGYRMGNGEVVDSMIYDGLWDCYGGQHMGVFGDLCASKFEFGRNDQDDYAVRSYQRARQAAEAGIFTKEIVPVEVRTRKGSTTVDADEEPARFNEEKLRGLAPAFGAEGTITAGNASSINDGAAALMIGAAGAAEDLVGPPLARIVADATFSQDPAWFTTAPIGAIRRLLEKAAWSADDVDLFEINEAFAAVTMAAEKELGLPPEKVNIYGGAVALGHPIGATGGRILVTLLTALRRTGGRRGIAALCIGGGESVAVAVETD